MSVFADRLKNLRNSKNQTQGDVGKAVGKSRESVSKYELGEREPDTEIIASLAKYFNVSADYILGITDDISALLDETRKPYHQDLFAYEKYLKDPKFIPCLQIAARIQDHGLDIEKVGQLIDKMIKAKRKHP